MNKKLYIAYYNTKDVGYYSSYVFLKMMPKRCMVGCVTRIYQV